MPLLVYRKLSNVRHINKTKKHTSIQNLKNLRKRALTNHVVPPFKLPGPNITIDECKALGNDIVPFFTQTGTQQSLFKGVQRSQPCGAQASPRFDKFSFVVYNCY